MRSKVCFPPESGHSHGKLRRSVYSHYRTFPLTHTVSTGRALQLSWKRSSPLPRLSAMAATSRSNWPKSPCPGTCFGKSCGGSMNCDEDPLRRRPRESTARRKRQEGCVWMARKLTEWPSKRGPITKIVPSDGCKGDTVPLAVRRCYNFHKFGGHLS